MPVQPRIALALQDSQTVHRLRFNKRNIMPVGWA